jgi:hypothetical protein
VPKAGKISAGGSEIQVGLPRDAELDAREVRVVQPGVSCEALDVRWCSAHATIGAPEAHVVDAHAGAHVGDSDRNSRGLMLGARRDLRARAPSCGGWRACQAEVVGKNLARRPCWTRGAESGRWKRLLGQRCEGKAHDVGLGLRELLWIVEPEVVAQGASARIHIRILGH